MQITWNLLYNVVKTKIIVVGVVNINNSSSNLVIQAWGTVKQAFKKK